MDLDHSKTSLNSGGYHTGWIAPSSSSLDAASLREETLDSLKDRQFEGILGHVATGGFFGFIECPAFRDNVFCHQSAWPASALAMERGLKLRFQVSIEKDMKKDVWGYAAKSVEVLSEPRDESLRAGTASEDLGVESSTADKLIIPPTENETVYSLDGEHGLQPVDPSGEHHEEIDNFNELSGSLPAIQSQHPTQGKPGTSLKPSFLEAASKRLNGDPQAHLRSVRFADSMATDIVVYLDEAWPKHGNQGVIAGVVWLAQEPDPMLLPLAPQHLRLQQDFTSRAVEFLTRLKNCPHAIPFIFRFTPPENLAPTDAYEEMVHESLLMLLGWIMPGRVPETSRKSTGVRIICEAIGADHHGGRNQTDVVRGLMLQAARRDPTRFERWAITEVRWVQKTEADPRSFSPWEVLNQGYLGYADLLAYLTLGEQSPNAELLAELSKPDEWAECLTISTGLANLMEQVHITAPAFPGDFLAKMAMNLGRPLIDRTLDLLRKKWKDDTEVKARILAEMDARYVGKVRDLPALSRQFEVIRRTIGKLPSDAPRRLLLIEMALLLQRANHFGDPLALAGLENDYGDLRRRALENGEADLVAHVDLNLAVCASDRFEPEQALLIVEDLIPEEPRLSLLSRAKLHSARGQYLSMTGDHQAARDAFNAALGLIGQADLTEKEREADWDQTAIYRAFNAIDAGFPETREQVDEVIRKGGIEPTLKHQFRHHLWLRFLFSGSSLAKDRQAYLDQISDDVLDQHPWQLIAMYRGLFAAELDRMEDAVKWFNRSLEIALGSMHGATLRAIAAVIATVAWQETGEAAFKEAAIGIVNGGWEDVVPSLPLTEALPTSAYIVVQLEKALHEDAPRFRSEEILGLLRFNYR